MKFLKTVSIASIALILSACAPNMNMLSQPKTPPASNSAVGVMPDWILNPLRSNAQKYYAIGEGKTQEEAKISALNQIASEISVSISSSLEVNKKATQNSYTKDVQSTVNATVEQINFTSATIEKNHFLNNRFYSLVSVNRSALFNASKSDLDKKMTEVDALWKFVQKDGVFELLVQEQKLSKLISETLVLSSLVKSINASFDEKPYDTKLNGIANSMRNQKSNMAVVVSSSNANVYADVLKNSLAANGIKIVNSQALNSKMLKISISKSATQRFVKTTSAALKDATFANVDIYIKTQNHLNKTVAQNVVKVTNISKTSYNDAVNNSSKFQNVLDEEGLLFVLTGKE
jgi:hypothetical protein